MMNEKTMCYDCGESLEGECIYQFKDESSIDRCYICHSNKCREKVIEDDMS